MQLREHCDMLCHLITTGIFLWRRGGPLRIIACLVYPQRYVEKKTEQTESWDKGKRVYDHTRSSQGARPLLRQGIVSLPCNSRQGALAVKGQGDPHLVPGIPQDASPLVFLYPPCICGQEVNLSTRVRSPTIDRVDRGRPSILVLQRAPVATVGATETGLGAGLLRRHESGAETGGKGQNLN